MKKITIGISMIITGLMLFFIPVQSEAAEGDVGYTVQAVLPSNQVNSGNTYFDLRMAPGQTEELQVKVVNESAEDTTFGVNINQAYTNENGFIDYSKNGIKLDSSLKYKASDIVQCQKNITVPANTTSVLPIKLVMPAESYDGEILAGIQVTKDPNQGKKTKGISNVYGYIIGLKLTETDNPVKRDLKMTGVKADTAFGKAAVIASLRNPTMDGIGKMKYEGEVDLKGESAPVKEFKYEDMSMAPNSTYDFAIDMGKKEFKAGDYTVKFTVSDAKGNKWKFADNFKVTAQKAKAVNDIVIPKEKSNVPTWIYAVLGALVAVVILLVIVLVRKKTDTKHAAK